MPPQSPISNNQSPDLPEDVVLSVRHVSKKFCRNLRRSMLYGMQDLGRNLLGLRGGGGVNGELLKVNRADPNTSQSTNNNSQLTNNNEAPGLRKDEFWALKGIHSDIKCWGCYLQLEVAYG